MGAENRRAIYSAFPQLPTSTPHDGRIAGETAYWSTPFEAPEWRAKWVQIR